MRPEDEETTLSKGEECDAICLSRTSSSVVGAGASLCREGKMEGGSLHTRKK